MRDVDEVESDRGAIADTRARVLGDAQLEYIPSSRPFPSEVAGHMGELAPVPTTSSEGARGRVKRTAGYVCR